MGIDALKAYLKRIQPPDSEKDNDQNGSSSWSRAQMQATPTLLPDLKFHNLVFGHTLGEGAFGSVQYARLIDKTQTRSGWAEYAVKIVSTAKIVEQGYQANLQREIAVLRILSHPGICRLVSSFSFGKGAYLVLEYAAGGDLHTLLRKQGSLSVESTQSVLGQVVAALAHVHELGLVYADLKPENLVFMSTGHVKVTDFGACRPVTVQAKALVQSSSQHLLQRLRSGDWRDSDSNIDENHAMEVVEEEEKEDAVASVTQHEEDLRIEGTTAYLPPEVVLGDFPTQAADTWALGCVMYQCLTGRPSLMDQDDESTRHRIVRFYQDEESPDVSSETTTTTAVDRLFAEKHALHVSESARSMIAACLERSFLDRPSMVQVATLDFFHDVNVFTLYQEPPVPLNVGTVSPSKDPDDEKWSRRQFSSIWAPQPKAYDLGVATTANKMNRTSSQSARKDPIPEGPEARMPFTRAAAGAQPPRLPTKPVAIAE